MPGWQANLLQSDEAIRELLASTHRIAVLGIKPETQPDQPAHFVPAYLQKAGYEVVPVPVYFPELHEMLGQPVYRSLAEIPGPIDLVDVFRRASDLPAHVPDILAKKPRAVWFQLGIRNDEVAQQLAEAGIQVVQNRCLMVDDRRLG